MNRISAVILGAGKSIRMGRQKLLMPWGDTTVLGRVIFTLKAADIDDIVLVTSSDVASKISDHNLQVVLNENGEMLASLQAGLKTVKSSADAVLICLGDQPQVEEGSVRSVCEAFLKNEAGLVVPSYKMRRGHPWLAARKMWSKLQGLGTEQTLRDFLNSQASEIEYVELNTPTILQDLDTPEDYLKYKPSM